MAEMIKIKFSGNYLSEDHFDLESENDWYDRLNPILSNIREKNSYNKTVKGYKNWLIGREGSMGDKGNNSARNDFVLGLMRKYVDALTLVS